MIGINKMSVSCPRSRLYWSASAECLCLLIAVSCTGAVEDIRLRKRSVTERSAMDISEGTITRCLYSELFSAIVDRFYVALNFSL